MRHGLPVFASAAMLLALTVGPLGCASCRSATPAGDADQARDGGADADGDSDTDADTDTEADTDRDVDADAELDAEVDADPDEDVDVPPGCERLDLEVVPHDRPGRACGPGCRQVTFGDNVVRWREYGVSGRYVVYSGSPTLWFGTTALYSVDLDTGREVRFERCTSDDGQHCTTPDVYDGVAAYSTVPSSGDGLRYTLQLHPVDQPYRCPLKRRTMTDADRPMMDVDIQGGWVAWRDSSVAPAGLWAMRTEGSALVPLTNVACDCFGTPHIWDGRAVYETVEDGPRDIHIVDDFWMVDRPLFTSDTPEFDPSFDGTWVVWTDGRNDPSRDPYWDRVNPDIYGMELSRGEVEPLCTHPAAQVWPDVHGGFVAWEDYRNAADPNDASDPTDPDPEVDIYVLDLATREEHRVTDLPGHEQRPRLWGHKLYFVAPDDRGVSSVFEIDLDVRLGS